MLHLRKKKVNVDNSKLGLILFDIKFEEKIKKQTHICWLGLV